MPLLRCKRGCLTFLIALAAARSAPALSIIDQQYINPTPQFGSNAGLAGAFPWQERAQTFTAGVSGKLESVDLFLLRSDFNSFVIGGLTAEIRATTSGGVPDSRPTPQGVLASAFVSGGDIPRPENAAFVNFAFPAPLAIAPGEVYAITLRADGTGSYGWQGGVSGGNGGYALGTSYERDNLNWFVHTNDLEFRTHVNVPEPSTAVVCAAMLAFGIAARRSAAR
jgi:hypothetical protein